MNDLLVPFHQALENPHKWIIEHKEKTGDKICGYMCDYVPEEILKAAGYTTVRVTAGKGEVTLADRYLQSNVCSFARRCLEQVMREVFDYLDGVVIPHTCDVINKLNDLWAYRMDTPAFLHYLWVPHKVFDDDAQPVMEAEIRRLIQTVEKASGEKITDKAILEAIELFNRNRSLLDRVYKLRMTSPPTISGVDAYAVALSSILVPKEIHNRWMENLLDGVTSSEPDSLENKPRILVSASILDDLELFTTVENSGAWVVADDICTSTRYFTDLVGDPDGDPVKALAHRYLNKKPCPRSVGSYRPRLDHILKLAEDYNVDGIIFYILRCCDAHMYQYPLLNERLKKDGYKVLYIQGDHGIGITDAISNRIDAFTEILSS